MYTLPCRAGWRSDWAVEAPGLVGALVLAEGCYKFHSFSLECPAFLATWFVLGGFGYWVRRLVCRPEV